MHFFLLFKHIFLYYPKDWILRSRKNPVLNIRSQTVYSLEKTVTPKVAGRIFYPEGRVADHQCCICNPMFLHNLVFVL